jgi:hypothetical protein
MDFIPLITGEMIDLASIFFGNESIGTTSEDIVPKRKSNTKDVVKILCFDDGRYRSFVSLKILQRMMEIVAKESRLNGPLLPHDCFDLICGSGGGGLIAIMLGRLRMVSNTVSHC